MPSIFVADARRCRLKVDGTGRTRNNLCTLLYETPIPCLLKSLHTQMRAERERDWSSHQGTFCIFYIYPQEAHPLVEFRVSSRVNARARTGTCIPRSLPKIALAVAVIVVIIVRIILVSSFALALIMIISSFALAL
jgi:hypothetical protein